MHSATTEHEHDTTSGSAPKAKMRAIVAERYGPSTQLRVQRVDCPVPRAEEVLVRVHAAGVDQGALHLITGLPYLVRLAGYGLRRPKCPIPGSELAGRVEAVGADVTRFAPGDEVFGTGRGAFAEFACASEAELAPKPPTMSFEDAATTPGSAQTALQALRDAAEVGAGDRVLILGASGGVGGFAVQIARALGASITGVCSAGKAELVRKLGAAHVIDYRSDDLWSCEQRFDVVIDLAGNRPLRRLLRLLTRGGTLVIVGGENGGRWTGGAGRQLRAMALTPFVRARLRGFLSRPQARDLREISALSAAGAVNPVVAGPYPLESAPEAFYALAQGHLVGKAVLVP